MRQIGPPISDYQGLIAALRARREALGISFAELDDFAEMPSGYCSKLLTNPREDGRGRNWRAFGPRSLARILSGLGVALQLVEDPVATRQAEALPKRDERYVNPRRESSRSQRTQAELPADN
jgi:hypothetical protein